jgi:hypothetical protein
MKNSNETKTSITTPQILSKIRSSGVIDEVKLTIKTDNQKYKLTLIAHNKYKSEFIKHFCALYCRQVRLFVTSPNIRVSSLPMGIAPFVSK